jgi:hypothetical protein
MNEVMFIALGAIPPLPENEQTDFSNGSEPSLLASNDPNKAPLLKFYMDDVFSGRDSD